MSDSPAERGAAVDATGAAPLGASAEDMNARRNDAVTAGTRIRCAMPKEQRRKKRQAESGEPEAGRSDPRTERASKALSGAADESGSTSPTSDRADFSRPDSRPPFGADPIRNCTGRGGSARGRYLPCSAPPPANSADAADAAGHGRPRPGGRAAGPGREGERYAFRRHGAGARG